MFYVEIQFANLTETMTFLYRAGASSYAQNLGEMFKAEEIWLDKERNTYIVSVPATEILK